MAKSIQELADQMEAELESALNEIERLQSVTGEIEIELDSRQITIDEQDEYIAELEEYVEFVKAHFPAADQAYGVRKRMEKASGTAAAVG